MRTRTYLSAIIALGSAAFFASTLSDSKPSNGLIESHFFDYGLVVTDSGQSISHDFKIVNSKNRPLTLKSFQQSCSCTKASIDQKIVQPGETATLSLLVSLTGIRKDDRAVVIAETDDPRTPQIKFVLSYSTCPKFEMQPTVLVVNSNDFDTNSYVAKDFVATTHVQNQVNSHVDQIWRFSSPQGVKATCLDTVTERLSESITKHSSTLRIAVDRSYYEKNQGVRLTIPVQFNDSFSATIALVMNTSSELVVLPSTLFFRDISSKNSSQSLRFFVKTSISSDDDLSFIDESGLIRIERVSDATEGGETREYSALVSLPLLARESGNKVINGKICVRSRGIQKAILPWTAFVTD